MISIIQRSSDQGTRLICLKSGIMIQCWLWGVLDKCRSLERNFKALCLNFLRGSYYMHFLPVLFFDIPCISPLDLVVLLVALLVPI